MPTDVAIRLQTMREHLLYARRVVTNNREARGIPSIPMKSEPVPPAPNRTAVSALFAAFALLFASLWGVSLIVGYWLK
jgi:hypothetical protein